MALGDLTGSRFLHSSVVSRNRSNEVSRSEEGDFGEQRRDSDAATCLGGNAEATVDVIIAYLPRSVLLCDYGHDEFENPSSNSKIVPSWRPERRMKTGFVALVLCLNIGVDPPDVMKISPCARMECWIDPFSMAAAKALKAIGDKLHAQYERWQSKARYKPLLDPTVDEVRRLCNTCRVNAKTERVLFHYNGHGVPKPTANGEIWLFNRGFTQYIPLPIRDLDSWLKTPSIYVFDCSAAGRIISAFIELQEGNSVGSSTSSIKDCILLAACEAHESLPQSVDFPADVFTSCLTTPIKMALTWLCSRSLLRDILDSSLIDKIPGQPNDRKTLLGELNWIFTAVADTIAWNILPHDLFQRLFRQDLLVASLFRNFLLAERIMQSANCSPVSYPLLPPTHQHHMWDAWDMVAEICLQSLVQEPEAEFQPSSFFNEQLTAFELWLDHGSHQHKKPPEQLPIVLWVLLSQCHRFRALILLGRFLDLGSWAVSLALSVGIFPYVLKLLQTPATELRQILVFIWTKILAFDKSCQVDLVKDGAHIYFIRFLDSMDAYPEQRAMAAFVLTVIVDGNKHGQEACVNSDLIHLCLRHLQSNDVQTEPLLLQWLCLCLGKLWEDYPEAQIIGLQAGASKLLASLLSEPQPEVRSSATFALGNLLDVGSASFVDSDEVNVDPQDDKKIKDEMNTVLSLLSVALDGSPLVRLEAAVALARFAFGHKKYLKSAAVAFGKHYNAALSFTSLLADRGNSCNVYSGRSCYGKHGQAGRVFFSSPATAGAIHGSPESEDSSQNSDSETSHDHSSNTVLSSLRPKHLDGEIYCRCALALRALAKDPSPRVAALGKQVLALTGIDPIAPKTLGYGGGSNLLGDLAEFFPTSNHARLIRSSSWFDLTADHLPLRFGITSASPQENHLKGMRRVFSGPHLANIRGLGLADSLLGSGESSSVSEPTLLPRSAIYNWSYSHFSKPLLSVVDDDEEILMRREKNEKLALDCIMKWKHHSVSRLSKQVVCWDTTFEAGTKAALMEPFSPVLIAADETERIRIWNYKEDIVLNSFDNHDFPVRGVSKLCLVNDLDNSLLLVASCDGNVRIWKDYTLMGEQKLVTAFSSVCSNGPGIQNVNAVVDWQQQSGYLFASGEISSIVLWDMEKEQRINSFPSSSDAGVSALSASQIYGGLLAAGFKDGSVRLYDIRTPEMIVCTKPPCTRAVDGVIGLGFQPGSDPLKIVSASQAGDIQFLDMKKLTEPYLCVESHGSLTAFAVHRHAPIIASGSAKLIEVFNLEGEQLGSIKYHQTLMGQRIGPVSCLNFHPYEVLLAAGADDALLSIYAD